MDWVDRFAGLAAMAPADRARLSAGARVLDVPEGAQVFGPGDEADNLLLLVSGLVRVEHLSEGGRQIVLYRIHAGESCVMTTACLMAHEAYSATGTAEKPSLAVAVPRTLFDAMVATSEPFRAFVFGAYAQRITDLFRLIEEVAFRRIDIRLAQRLLDLAGCRGTLRVTHAQLATELGTVREVVSRQLTEFRRRGLIAAGRGEIALTDREGLRALAGPD